MMMMVMLLKHASGPEQLHCRLVQVGTAGI